VVFKGFLLILGGTPVYIAVRYMALRKPVPAEAARAVVQTPPGGLPAVAGGSE
jgi:hypothetical protein